MKRKKQPTADAMREQLRLAADEIIRLRTEIYWFNLHSGGPAHWGSPTVQQQARMVALSLKRTAEMTLKYIEGRTSWWHRLAFWK